MMMAEDLHDRNNLAAGGGATQTGGPPAEQVDQAGKSLTDALRVSFRLLRGIMIVVVFLFLVTGLKSVDPDEVGLKKLFGRIVGVVDEGLVYTWPFPVGDVEMIDTKERELTIDDFWMHETPEDKTKDLSSRRFSKKGLKPGWDGALLTGDRNLLHVRLKCTYVVGEPVAYTKHVSDPRESVRSVVCAAAIRAAARRTADGLLRAEQKQFANEVRMEAQHRLDVLRTGISINRIELNQTTWPLRALPAYNAAQRAVSNAERRKDAALAGAIKILNAAAGPGYRKLVGDPWRRDNRSLSGAETAGDYNLIGQYSDARSSGDMKKAQRLLRKIDEVILSRTTAGQASKIIAEARTYRTATIQRAKSRAERFMELLPEFKKNPQFMLERLWASVREEILDSPTVEKIYLTSGESKTVLRINRDSETAKQIMRERLKASKEAESGRQTK